ncbi:MAG: hypothetical protein OHK0029_17560 [Armatimonadaceae bacterium]
MIEAKSPSEYTKEEVARLAHEIYERDIKAHVEPEHTGKYLVLDVLTGKYVMDADDLVVSDRAQDLFPEGVRFGIRIGYRAWGKF